MKMIPFFKTITKKIIIVIAIAGVVGAATVCGIWAYLASRPDPITNEFVPANVSCEIDETFENGVKSDVSIRNTGNVPAYIRAIVVVNFQNSNGEVLATAPEEGKDYTVIWAKSGWIKGSDGFWYYSSAVAPGKNTTDLIESAGVITAPESFALNIRVIASAIQAEPAEAVNQAWNVSVSNGILIPDR